MVTIFVVSRILLLRLATKLDFKCLKSLSLMGDTRWSRFFLISLHFLLLFEDSSTVGRRSWVPSSMPIEQPEL